MEHKQTFVVCSEEMCKFVSYQKYGGVCKAQSLYKLLSKVTSFWPHAGEASDVLAVLPVSYYPEDEFDRCPS